jgi:hypothetical protein
MRKLKSGCIVDIVEYARRAPNEIDISKRNALQERPPASLGTPSSLSWCSYSYRLTQENLPALAVL